jgi:pimeloyl-ACP methyl ester carboxylesterase
MLNDFRQADQLADDPPPLTTPLLVIHGSADPLAPFSGAQKLLAVNPQAETLIFKDGGHLSFLLQQPQTKKAIMDFLGIFP